MFKEPRKNVIESDEGFKVEVLGRTGLKYCEGVRTMVIDSEILASDKKGLMVVASSIQNWENEKDKIGKDEKERILGNLKRAFKFKGFDIEVL